MYQNVLYMYNMYMSERITDRRTLTAVFILWSYSVGCPVISQIRAHPAASCENAPRFPGALWFRSESTAAGLPSLSVCNPFINDPKLTLYPVDL